ncbi:hypothetical protein QBC35DRAFT_471111 [Podospora australis]|uniref:Uncharacterized protein n=1 Tax=Podospora australis TaxID=1536484 RepID=A0AAN6WZV1_9PEZI|nr:hypothetical protein QBC35DRAFT_471111 [Podospora australis]
MKFSALAVIAAALFSSTTFALASTFDAALGAPHSELELRAPRGKGKHHHAHGVLADFRKPCVCEADRCPTFLNKKALCVCQAAHIQGCYLKSQNGCPKPSAKTWL